jgi:hypothetical protein
VKCIRIDGDDFVEGRESLHTPLLCRDVGYFFDQRMANDDCSNK